MESNHHDNLGISELDRLLALDTPLNHGTRFLIRGGPGAGKTTLALQLLAGQLQKDRDNASKCSRFGLYLSLEQPPEVALGYYAAAYPDTMGDIQLGYPGRDIWESGRMMLMDKNDFLAKWTVEEGNLYGQMEPRIEINPLVTGSEKQRIIATGSGIVETLPSIEQEKLNSDCELWVLIDSINLLEHLLAANFSRKQNRSMIDDFCVIVADKLSKHFLEDKLAETNLRVIFLMTSEHHAGDSYNFGHVAESFLCDIEIVLALEAVTGFAHIPIRNLAASGYNVELHQAPNREVKPGFVRTIVETRPFCRILKNRLGKNQSRRCSYAIEPKRGVVFNDIYPGDGHILVFAENERQWIDWEDFLHRDAPYEYPALRYEIFDRSGLQRVFATQRRLLTKPTSTDLSIATFDTYWIRWNIEMRRRAELSSWLKRTLVAQHCQCTFFPNKVFNNFACDFDWACTLTEHISKMRQVGDINAEARLNKILRELTLRMIDGASKSGLGAFTEETIPYLLAEASKLLAECHGMFYAVPTSRLQLFGRKCSILIPELSDRDYQRPAVPPVSVPYNINVSFLVTREDLLLPISSEKYTDILATAMAMAERNQTRIMNFVREFLPQVQNIWPEGWDNFEYKPIDISATISNRGPLTAGSTFFWEEIIALCDRQKANFAGETQTFDTFICLFLEIFWGCGGNFEVNEAYELTKPGETAVGLFHALVLLRSMFSRDVLPQGSTLEPKTFGKRYSTEQKDSPKWAFARHWYSTLVDQLTARDGSDFAWRDSEANLKISPMPWSLLTKEEAKLHRDGSTLDGISCWGEWHLAVLKGTENSELAIDLINNLMSSQKISERALRGAGLPTVEEFYSTYSDSPIFRFPERTGIELPQMTYGELRKKIFKCAKSRTAIFDFRHCMRELHGLLEYVENSPNARSQSLGNKLIDALRRIRALRDCELLLR